MGKQWLKTQLDDVSRSSYLLKPGNFCL